MHTSRSLVSDVYRENVTVWPVRSSCHIVFVEKFQQSAEQHIRLQTSYKTITCAKYLKECCKHTHEVTDIDWLLKHVLRTFN